MSVSQMNVAGAAPIPAPSTRGSRSKKRKTQPAIELTASTSSTAIVPALTDTSIVPVSTSTAIVPASPAAAPPTSAAVVPVTAVELASTAIAPMDSQSENAPGSVFSHGYNVVASALSGLSTKVETRKSQFKQHADFAKARDGRRESAEKSRKEKRSQKFQKKRDLGSPKQPGQQGYVQQQVATKNQEAQVQQAINGL